MSRNLSEEIDALTLEIERQGDIWELYYQRGYLYFLTDNDVKAKDDYKHAEALGLDSTELPYYSFSNSNSKRRPLLLPEKILVFIILIMVIIALFVQISDFVIKVKGTL